jgi:DNA-binding PadR family transcriptional regulator
MKATKRKNTRTAKARAFMQSNPAAAPNEVAVRFGLTKQSIYVLRNTMKKKGFVFPKRSEQLATLAPAPKRYTINRTQLEIAKKLGFSDQDYVQALADMGMLDELATEDSQEHKQTGIEMYEDEVDATLDARAVEYGKFIEGAEVMQMLKRVVQAALNNRDKTLAHDQAEAMDMIIHKIGRIVNGNPDVVDHWLDIAGYAQLVADRLEGRVR